jgi:hypothetical protein
MQTYPRLNGGRLGPFLLQESGISEEHPSSYHGCEGNGAESGDLPTEEENIARAMLPFDRHPRQLRPPASTAWRSLVAIHMTKWKVLEGPAAVGVGWKVHAAASRAAGQQST